MSRGRRTPAKDGFVSNIDGGQSTSQATSFTMGPQKADRCWVAPWLLIFLLMAGFAVYMVRTKADMDLSQERSDNELAQAKLRSSLTEEFTKTRRHLMMSLSTAHKCYEVLHQASKFLYRTIASFNQTAQEIQDQTLFQTIFNTLSQSKSSGAEDLSSVNRYDTTQLEECELEMEIIRYEFREFGDQLSHYKKSKLVEDLHVKRDAANRKVGLTDDSNASKNKKL